MQKYFKIWWRVVKAGVMIRLMYKTDWFVGLLANSIYMMIYFAFIYLMFEAGGVKEIFGYSRSDFLLVMCLSEMLLFSLYINVIPSVHRLADGIYSGKLDMVMLKPVNLMAYSSIFNSWLMDALSVMFLNAVLFFGVYFYYDYYFSLQIWLLIMWVMFVSFVIYSLMFFISSLIWFFWPKFGALRWFLGYAYDINKYPRKIYPDTMQYFLIFVSPLFLVVNPIYDVLLGKYNLDILMVTLLMVFVLVGVYVLMFRNGLRRYGSAA